MLKSIDKLLGLAFGCLLLSFGVARGQVHTHQNSVEIKRASSTEVSFDFELNLPPMLHRMLAPQANYAAFLKAQTELSDQDLDRQLRQVSNTLSDKAYLVLPSGARVKLTQWQLPDRQAVRQAMVYSLVFMNLPAHTPAHIDPMRVKAGIQSKLPLNRVELQLPAVMHPIWVAHQSDKFWLTDQIPTTIIELK